MKKVLVCLLSIVLVFSSVFFIVGCGDKDNNAVPRYSDLPDFADCEIGYKLPVYPNHPFDYEMSDGTIVHIEKIEATLTAKNEITLNETIKGYFYPYEVTVVVVGVVDESYIGKTIGVMLSNGAVYCDIKSDLTFFAERKALTIKNSCLFFERIFISIG